MAQLYHAPAPHIYRRTASAPEKYEDWRARAVAAHRERAGGPAQELAWAVLALTGQHLGAEQSWADPTGRAATATLDGVRFRWEGGVLSVMRPCAHCGTGLLASPPLRAPADLGHALSAWRPRHAGCEEEDPAE